MDKLVLFRKRFVEPAKDEQLAVMYRNLLTSSIKARLSGNEDALKGIEARMVAIKQEQTRRKREGG